MQTAVGDVWRKGRLPAVLIGLATAVVVAVGAPALAHAAPIQLTWSAPVSIDTNEADPHALSCPDVSFCAATDLAGNVITSTNPTGGAGAWQSAHIDTQPYLLDISCTSSSFCAAVDYAGNLLTSTEPTGGASAWDSINPASEILVGISCPTSSFCAAVGESSGGHSELWTSTNPTGGASAWHTAAIDPGHRLSDVDCPSTALCVAVDRQGNELTSTNPTGGAGAWSAPQEIATRTNEIPEPLNSVDCPTTGFCAITEGYEYLSFEGYSTGNVAVSTNPTGGAGAWTLSPAMANGLFGLTCPIERYCLSVDESGNAYSLEATGAIAWTTTSLEPLNYSRVFSGVACPSAELCLVIDTEGNLFIGKATGLPHEEHHDPPPHEEPPNPLPPIGPGDGGPKNELPPASNHGTGGTISSAQLRAMLTSQLTPKGKTAKIGALLKHGGLTMPFKALEPGTLSVKWFYLPKGARLAKAKPVLIAVGTVGFTTATTRSLAIRLTAAGKRLLRHAQSVRIAAQGAFVPAGGSRVSLTLKQLVTR